MVRAEEEKRDVPIGEGLGRHDANFVPLSPLSLLLRTAEVHPDRVAVRYAGWSRTYRDFERRCRLLGGALAAFGIEAGGVVSILAPNTPAHLEAHFGVPMAGAVLHSINIRLDAPTIAFMLDHAASRLLIVDEEFAPLARAASALLDRPIPIVHVPDPTVPSDPIGFASYEQFLETGAESFAIRHPADEWDAIAINYTSGTTGDPKGVVYHHRGAYLNAIGNTLAWEMGEALVYLWTLPMFHCNGWCFPWTITAKAGTHVCMRRVDAAAVAAAIAGEGVTHFCGAPIVLAMLADAPEPVRAKITPGVRVMTAGAPPPASVISRIQDLGLEVTHTYGLTETYGPCVICEPKPEWLDLDLEQQAARKARQGVRYHLQEALAVCDPETLEPVPSDGKTLGEVLIRGNIMMKGYAGNAPATEAAFADGWFRSGDLGVRHPDGYLELKDRSKDVVISGGENISTIEVEAVLFAHPAVREVAVVAKPDPKWGEVPCAFIALREGQTANAEEIISFARERLAAFKIPKAVIFGEIPKTATGKVQKFLLRERARSEEGSSDRGRPPQPR